MPSDFALQEGRKCPSFRNNQESRSGVPVRFCVCEHGFCRHLPLASPYWPVGPVQTMRSAPTLGGAAHAGVAAVSTVTGGAKCASKNLAILADQAALKSTFLENAAQSFDFCRRKTNNRPHASYRPSSLQAKLNQTLRHITLESCRHWYDQKGVEAKIKQ